MNIEALTTTFKLATVTSFILLFLALPLAYWVAFSKWRWKFLVEAIIALPLVLPPTVLGFYVLLALGPGSPLGRLELPFTFKGLVVGSVLYSLPFAVQPMAAAFGSVERKYIEASWMLGVVLSFAHTVGEFGVVLMIGGNIPGVTRTMSIDIYDKVQALDYGSAAQTSALLLVISFVILSIVYGLNRKGWFFAADRRHRQTV
jgi:molybdate transport system permease protein